MNIFPPEIRILVVEGKKQAVWIFVVAGAVALLEAAGVANFFLLGHVVLGQEIPSALGGTFVDRFLSESSQRFTLIVLGSAFMAITVLRHGFYLVYRYLGFKWSSTTTAALRKRIMARIISANLNMFSERTEGEIYHGLFVAPVGAEVAVDSIVSVMFAIFLILAIGVTLGLASPWLFLGATIVGIIFFVAVVQPSRTRVNRYQQRRYERQSSGSEIAASVINGIRDIRAVGGENRWAADFAAEVDQWEAARMRAQFHLSLPGPTLQTALQVIFGAGVVVSVLILSPEDLVTQLPAFGVFAYGLLRALPALNLLGVAWIRLSEALPNLQAAWEWTSLPQDTLADGTVEVPRLKKGIRFEGVSFSYEEGAPVLVDTDFHLEAGKTTALVGPSGTGKSTLIDLLLKFRSPDRGTIWLDDQDLADVVRQSWLDKVGLVRQDVYLLATSMRANLLAWQPTASEEEMRQACREAGIIDFIDALPGGLDTIVGERGVTLSAGQRQRLAVARALLRKPNFLILDEATSALDGETESQVLHSLSNDTTGRTTVVISHRLATVRDADQIIVVDQGRVVEQGTHEELVARRGRYWQLFITQEEALQFSDHPELAREVTR